MTCKIKLWRNSCLCDVTHALWNHLISCDLDLFLDADDWLSEYKRLVDNVPLILTEVLTQHTHQVLHATFSNNGQYFSTCSKDGFVYVWTSGFPAQIKHSYDMKELRWKYSQFSQWNRSDTLLLVSGVHFGSLNSTSGEIAVFSVVGGFSLKCRVQSKPYGENF